MKKLCLLPLFASLSLSAQVGLTNAKQTWKLIDVSSENVLTGELARMAFDGDPETQWHTRWHAAKDGAAAKPPHHITFALPEPTQIKSVRIRTRAHGEGGFPKKCLLEVGTDGELWETAAITELNYRSRMSPHASITLKSPRRAKYIRLTIHSIHPSQKAKDPGLVIGEIDVESASRLHPTTTIPVPQSRERNYGGYHWRKRHQAILEHNRENPGRLVFIGDSITHRWGAPPFDETPQTGKDIWNQYYAHRQAINLGYGWDRVENMIWRIEAGELEQTDPDLVVIMAGTNNLEVNTPEEIASGVLNLCVKVHKKKPEAKILLLAVFPRGANAYPEALVDLNKRLTDFGKLDFITFKDIGHVFLNEEGKLTREIMPDLLHPGAEGYRLWAEAIEEDVARILGDAERSSR